MQKKLLKKILEIEVDISVIFAKREILLEEIYSFEVGKVIKLNKKIGEKSAILVNNQNIGEGEIIIKDSKFAIKIEKLKSRDM